MRWPWPCKNPTAIWRLMASWWRSQSKPEVRYRKDEADKRIWTRRAMRRRRLESRGSSVRYEWMFQQPQHTALQVLDGNGRSRLYNKLPILAWGDARGAILTPKITSNQPKDSKDCYQWGRERLTVPGRYGPQPNLRRDSE